MNLINFKLIGLVLLLLGLGSLGLAQTQVFEDFEAGFSKLPWDVPYDPWVITDSERHSGTYSASAGYIGDGEQSWLTIRLDISVGGEISFWYKVSSESGHDFLRFFIDGQEMDKWSGGTGWQKVIYRVPAGKHTFTWTYTKDSSGSQGKDTAWIDDISFPTAQFVTPACSVTISPGSSIQRAIDAAPLVAYASDYVICLEAGEWEENLVITKNLTLLGAGSDKTRIKGKIEIAGEVCVEIGYLSITNSRSNGITVRGNSEVRVHHCIIGDNGGHGVAFEADRWSSTWCNLIKDNAGVGISRAGHSYGSDAGNVIRGNKEGGIYLAGRAHNIEIEANNISANKKGGIAILLPAGYQVKITRNIISNNRAAGIAMMGTVPCQKCERIEEPRGAVEKICLSPDGIHRNEIFGNGGGIYIAFAFLGASSITDNRIYRNRGCGLFLNPGGCLPWQYIRMIYHGNSVHDNEDNYCIEQ